MGWDGMEWVILPRESKVCNKAGKGIFRHHCCVLMAGWLVSCMGNS
jgi:hypothetical protein